MIARDAVPIGHRPPYKRIDLAHPNRKGAITLEDVQSGREREPDLAAYRFVHGFGWVLKELP
jgi:hypothetical protein